MGELLENVPKGEKTPSLKWIFSLMWETRMNRKAILYTIAKTWKQPRCPSTDKWIKKMWYIYMMEYYSAIRSDEIRPFVTTRMVLEGIMLSEISQREKVKYLVISLTSRR
uniref:Uncharacterized protein n=1 Tax=Equus asinus TaxID=9793 RepID=A0A9L0II32_EQUAS